MRDLLLMKRRMDAAAGRGYSRRRRNDSNTQRGVIKDGSCTDKVLAVLTEEAPRALGLAEIARRSECPPKSVSWSLYYLRSINKIQCISALDRRSPLYLLYKLAGSK